MPNLDNTDNQPPSSQESLSMILRNLETRLEKLESGSQKSSFRRITENAGAVALFPGLVLSLTSLYDVLVTKPRADRINAIAQFNRAVSSAAQIRQELVEAQNRTGGDPATRLGIASFATPRILNDISTAKAILPELRDADVGIPQLITLISESFTAGDLSSAKEFVTRAVGKTDASPFLRSEAKRYQGKFSFSTGEPERGRQAFQEALMFLGDSPGNAAARAYALGDLTIYEFSMGDCTLVEGNVDRFASALRSGPIALEARRQMAGAVMTQFQQFDGQHCPMPKNASVLASV